MQQNIESLRSQFGLILQDDSLFSLSIDENLALGLQRKVSQEEMEYAARNANILDFIESQPRGFKTALRQHGHDLSGGQRQRLVIARVFLRHPRILIIDEPSSALDTDEALIQQALKRLMQSRTAFIIARGLRTIHNTDHIIVIDEGKVAKQGTHDELLRHLLAPEQQLLSRCLVKPRPHLPFVNPRGRFVTCEKESIGLAGMAGLTHRPT